MERRVFISHAARDADWPEAEVEAVAEAIRASGVAVSLDLWHQLEAERNLSLAEWRHWMDEALESATHVLCLVSPHYNRLWGRRPGVEGGYGEAFEAIRLVHALYQQNLNKPGFILTLRPPGRGLDSIPLQLRLDCPSYVWARDRTQLLSHLGDAELPKRDSFSAPPESDSNGDDMAASIASSSRLSDELILDGLRYPEVQEKSDSNADLADSKFVAAEVATTDDAAAAATAAAAAAAEDADQATDDVVQVSIAPEVDALVVPRGADPSVDTASEEPIPQQLARATKPQLGKSGLWPVADEWRAPVGDFPPPWASAWGDDPYGLWADLTVNGATQRMRWIEPSGSEGFWMGSTKQERAAIKHKQVREWANSREHEPMQVVIAKGFWLADTPCTQVFWQAVTGKNPSHFSKGGEAPERPVENVSWNDVDERFVRRFAQTPAWGTDDRLCLPSEEQWEYAARAGTRSAYWWGDDWDAARGNANVTGERSWNDEEGTTPVHRHAPNPWGLFDMHGNVWEFCSDIWQARRDAQEARPDEEGRMVRGGSWFDRSGLARAACRDKGHRRVVGRDQGFRFALRSPARPDAR